MFSLLYEDEGVFCVFCLFLEWYLFWTLKPCLSILLTVISKQDRNLLEFLTIVIWIHRVDTFSLTEQFVIIVWKLLLRIVMRIVMFWFFFQVTSLLRRVLPEVTPSRLASIIGVKALPPADISDIIHSTEKGDWNKLGILDMFLGCIAKALTVQLKAKGTTITGTAGTTAGKGVTTVTLPMIFNSRFVLKCIYVLKLKV